MFLICPNTESCLVYKNFKQKTKNDRIDIIQNYGTGYACIALYALQEPGNGGITATKKLAKRIKGLLNIENRLSTEIGCSQMIILNGLTKLTKN